MVSQNLLLVAVAMCILPLITLGVNGVKLAIISSGAPSELLQIASIVRAAYQRNHSTLVLVDTLKLSSCEDVLERSLCAPVICPQGRCYDNSQDPSGAFLAVLRKRNFSPDIVIAAVFLDKADWISEKLGVPLVILSENAEDVPSIQSTSLHILPLSLGERYPLLDTVASAIHGFAASAQDLIGFGALPNSYMIRHIITQGIPGIDITGPICPNVHPVGFLRGDSEPMTKRSFVEMDTYVESCGGRFIYANLQAENNVHGQQLYRALLAVANETNTCVIWYIPAAKISSLRFRRFSEDQRVKVTDGTFAAPSYALRRHKPVLVLTSNLKEILYDAVLAESPIVYVGGGRFSCSPLRNADIGTCLATSRADDIVSAVRSLYNNSSVREHVQAARRMGFLMGGAEKAIKVVELAAAMGVGSMDFMCERNILMSPYGYDTVIAVSVTFLLGLLCSLGFHCCKLVLKRQPVGEGNSKVSLL
ncbi:unspecified product [Leishmania tarentolae]|uniref:Unspecified product n=1 Tax=Leishmania tarentolae TaxID=5689 RepID=A0A640KT30_LEITA|nr:unspecified product [Leishmania tarentolae]